MEFLTAVLIVIVSAYVVDAAAADNTRNILPVLGVQMCKTRCKKTAGCRIVFYDIARLMCKLADGEEKPELNNFRYCWRNEQVPMKTCNSLVDGGQYMTLETRSGSTKCIHASTRVSEHRPYSWTSLLVGSSNIGTDRFFTMDLKDGTFQEYPYFNFTNAKAFAFVSDLRLIIVCTNSPGKIIATKLRTYEEAKTLKTGITVGCIAVDQKMLMLFFGLTNNSIGRMSLRDNEHTHVKISKHKYPVVGIAVGSNKKIYLACIRDLYLFSYELMYLKTIDNGKTIKALTFSLDTQLLYYQNKRDIKRFKLSDGSTSKVYRLRSYYPIVGGIVNVNGSLYIAYIAGERVRFLDVVNLSDSTHVKEERIYNSPISDGTMFCLI